LPQEKKRGAAHVSFGKEWVGGGGKKAVRLLRFSEKGERGRSLLFGQRRLKEETLPSDFLLREKGEKTRNASQEREKVPFDFLRGRAHKARTEGKKKNPTHTRGRCKKQQQRREGERAGASLNCSAKEGKGEKESPGVNKKGKNASGLYCDSGKKKGGKKRRTEHLPFSGEH